MKYFHEGLISSGGVLLDCHEAWIFSSDGLPRLILTQPVASPSLF